MLRIQAGWHGFPGTLDFWFPLKFLQNVTFHYNELSVIQCQVMESTNRGMEVLWGTRLSDGQQCVVKTRQKAWWRLAPVISTLAFLFSQVDIMIIVISFHLFILLQFCQDVKKCTIVGLRCFLFSVARRVYHSKVQQRNATGGAPLKFKCPCRPWVVNGRWRKMYKKAKNVRLFGYGMLRPRKINKLCEIYEVLGWFLVAIQFLVLEIFEFLRLRIVRFWRRRKGTLLSWEKLKALWAMAPGL